MDRKKIIRNYTKLLIPLLAEELKELSGKEQRRIWTRSWMRRSDFGVTNSVFKGLELVRVSFDISTHGILIQKLNYWLATLFGRAFTGVLDAIFIRTEYSTESTVSPVCSVRVIKQLLWRRLESSNGLCMNWEGIMK